MKEKELMEQEIVRIVYYVTGIQVRDLDQNLLSSNLHIPIEDFLYIFDELEQSLNLPVCTIMEEKDYTFFTVRQLAKYFESLYR